MSELGILSAEQESAVGKKIDLLLDFKKIKGLGVLEIIDGVFFTQALKFVDNNYGDKLPDAYKEVAGKFVIDLVAEDWAAVADDAVDLVDMLVDVPFVEGEAEAELIHTIVVTALDLIIGIAAKKAK